MKRTPLKRKVPAKKKKPPTKTRMKQAADSLFSKLVRARDGVCQKCSVAIGLQCAHIVSRRYLAVRWSFDNAVALCQGCHVFFTHRPLEWDLWVAGRIGEDAYDALKRRALAGRTEEIADVLARLKEQSKEIA